MNYLRTELGLPPATSLKVKLASADSTKQRELLLEVQPELMRHGPWPRLPSRLINGVGYLRILSMTDEPKDLGRLDDIMNRFRDTRGIIVDVRGNGGGTHDTLRKLLPYFLPADAPTKFINVTAYRLPVRLPRPCAEGYLGLANRGLYPVTSKEWTEPEKQQIAHLLQGFRPEWKLPAGLWSEWHVMGIRRTYNPRAYFYDRPVVVLCDAGCFSATDNFLGAFKGLPNVTLMGTASGGGSGRMANYTLPNTRIPLTICQMASFRTNGGTL